MLTKSRDPWLQTLSLLGFMSFADDVSVRARAATARGSRKTRATREVLAVSVKIIDRPSSTTATVSWSDPTSGYYGDQVWRSGVARGEGVCVISGQLISRGDAVYKPRICRLAPLNAHAMILSSVILDDEA